MQKKGVKIGSATVGVLALMSAIGFGLLCRIPPKIQGNVSVAGVNVGGLTPADAAYKIRVWWESKKREPLQLVWSGHSEKFPSFTPGRLDVTIDDLACVNQLPIQTPLELVGNSIHAQDAKPQSFKPIFKRAGIDPVIAYKSIDSVLPSNKPASVNYVSKKGLVLTKEVSGAHLDRDQLFEAVVQGELTNTPVQLPISEAPKHISDADLAKITDYISGYTTYYPSRQTDRDNNIKTAAMKINGTILLPGEEFSFNKRVGMRTKSTGFRLAPVFKNGQHAVGIGGGICQVSTTLYNATLLGDLKITQRQNHSLPVGYIKLGRDATVDWGEIDLRFKNNYSTPIAICAQVTPGSLTFKVFGQATKGQSVDIERTGLTVVPRPVQYVFDSHLKPGQQRVVQPGHSGIKIKTYRLVYQDGKLVNKQYLGQSSYRLEPRIIARGPGQFGAIIPPQPANKK